MQPSKSREDLDHFDTFTCLNCNTTIVQKAPRKPPPPPKAKPGDD